MRQETFLSPEYSYIPLGSKSIFFSSCVFLCNQSGIILLYPNLERKHPVYMLKCSENQTRVFCLILIFSSLYQKTWISIPGSYQKDGAACLNDPGEIMHTLPALPLCRQLPQQHSIHKVIEKSTKRNQILPVCNDFLFSLCYIYKCKFPAGWEKNRITKGGQHEKVDSVQCNYRGYDAGI